MIYYGMLAGASFMFGTQFLFTQIGFEKFKQQILCGYFRKRCLEQNGQLDHIDCTCTCIRICTISFYYRWNHDCFYHLVLLYSGQTK